jgi:hypothetical protein
MGRMLVRPQERGSNQSVSSQDGRIHAYLTEGRMHILEVSEATIRAVCKGLRGVYRMGWEAESGWWCSCGSTGSCTHLSALQLVTDPV